MEQDVAQRQHRRHALCVLLDVPLQILQVIQHRDASVSTTSVTVVDF